MVNSNNNSNIISVIVPSATTKPLNAQQVNQRSLKTGESGTFGSVGSGLPNGDSGVMNNSGVIGSRKLNNSRLMSNAQKLLFSSKLSGSESCLQQQQPLQNNSSNNINQIVHFESQPVLQNNHLIQQGLLKI